MDARSFQPDPDGTWSTGANLSTSGDERTKIILRRPSGPADESHLSAAIDVVRRWKELQEAMQRALFAFYCSTAANATESGPPIGSPPEVWESVDFSEVEVFSDEGGNAEYVQAFGRCSWEEEHGLEVVIRGTGELIYVGSYEGWTYGDLRTDQEWNFANPLVQQSAIAEQRLSDSEFADFAASQSAAPAAPVAKDPRRQWWKLW